MQDTWVTTMQVGIDFIRHQNVGQAGSCKRHEIAIIKGTENWDEKRTSAIQSTHAIYFLNKKHDSHHWDIELLFS